MGFLGLDGPTKVDGTKTIAPQSMQILKWQTPL
jgi:hypothetical protein